VPLPRRVFQGPKQRLLRVLAVAGGFEVIVEALQGQRVGRHVPNFAALAQDAQVGHALAALEARAPAGRRDDMSRQAATPAATLSAI
jgi:hypothetical protein